MRDVIMHAETVSDDMEGPLWGVIRGGMASAADLFMMQLLDVHQELG